MRAERLGPLLASTLWVGAALLSVASGEPLEAAEESALALDEQCAGTAEECAISAMQLRAHRQRAGADAGEEGGKPPKGGGQPQPQPQPQPQNHGKPKWGSCLQFGCVEFRDWQGCQCHMDCHKYNNCCDDFAATCGTLQHFKAQDPGTCLQYGCVQFTSANKCQCDVNCHANNNCCPDYSAHCPAVQQLAAAPPPPRPASGKIYGHPRPGAGYPAYPGFTLTLVEEFDVPLDLDKDSIWTWSDGGLKEGGVRFVKEAIKFEGGKMVIEMSNTLKVPTQACSNAEVSTIEPKPLTSGEIRTRHNMFRYGIYEARIKAPYVQNNNPAVNGNFVATLFVFRGGKYKHWRELDFEITGNKIDSVSTNVLYADNTAEWKPGIGEEQVLTLGVNVRADFHEYRIEWLPDKVTWFVDGRSVREMHPGGRIKIPDMSVKIMANLWLFRDDDVRFGGNEMWNNRYPMRSEYDWIRFYKWDGDQQYPCADMTDSCLTQDDKYLSANNGCDGIKQVGDIYGQTIPCFAKCR